MILSRFTLHFPYTKSTRQNSDLAAIRWPVGMLDSRCSYFVWYCLGRDPYSSGLWECWMIGIFSILLLVLDTIDKIKTQFLACWCQLK